MSYTEFLKDYRAFQSSWAAFWRTWGPFLRDGVITCAICGTRTTWAQAQHWSSRLSTRGQRFYLCAEDECLRQESRARKQGE